MYIYICILYIFTLEGTFSGMLRPQTPRSQSASGLRHAPGRRPGAVAQQIEDFQRSKSKAKKQSKKQSSKAKKQHKKQTKEAKKQGNKAKQNNAKQSK